MKPLDFHIVKVVSYRKLKQLLL
uniref:Uncharacterized protein n=1 Tax=Rhizophora mucronata TaxID=61149 RepID=A0A2P2J4M7_RHIMU